MKQILGFSDAFILAIHAMAMLCGTSDKLVSTNQIAKKLDASENHLSKILQRLSKAGFVAAVRGPNGGFKLGKPSRDINLLGIYEAIEGPLDTNICLMGYPVCKGDKCMLDDLPRNITRDIHMHFSKTTLNKVRDLM